MSEIGKYQGPPSKLDAKLEKDLRSHHYGNFSGISMEYNTEYRERYIDPDGLV